MKRFLIVFLLGALATAQTKHPEELKQLPNLTDTIDWLSGASQEEAGWGGGSFQFSSDGKCNAELSTIEIVDNSKSNKNIRRTKYAFRLADIDPFDIRFEYIKASVSYNVIQFHTYNYKEKISFVSYKDATSDLDDKEPAFSDMVRTPFTSSLRTNDWFAPRFVKAFKRAVELCGGRKSSY